MSSGALRQAISVKRSKANGLVSMPSVKTAVPAMLLLVRARRCKRVGDVGDVRAERSAAAELPNAAKQKWRAVEILWRSSRGTRS